MTCTKILHSRVLISIDHMTSTVMYTTYLSPKCIPLHSGDSSLIWTELYGTHSQNNPPQCYAQSTALWGALPLDVVQSSVPRELHASRMHPFHYSTLYTRHGNESLLLSDSTCLGWNLTQVVETQQVILFVLYGVSTVHTGNSIACSTQVYRGQH